MSIKHESLRTSKGNNIIVRLFCDLIDDRWLTKTKEDKFLVTVYSDKHEKYIPKHDPSKSKIDKLHIWADEYYSELAGSPKARNKSKQIQYARTKLKACTIDRYWFSTFLEAQDAFIAFAKSECGNTEKVLTIGDSI